MAKPPVALLAFANDREGRFLRNISEEHRLIKAALIPLVDKGLLELEELPNASASDIFAAFRKHKDRIQIFHYGGHAQDLEILLNGSKNPLDVRGLAKYLSLQKGLKLVFMNACATASQQPAFAQAGIPHLILTQTTIHDRAAKNFAASFYQNIASGSELQRAFSEAKATIEAELGGEKRNLFWENAEEEIRDTLVWQYYSAAPAQWRLATEIPFPWRKTSIVFSTVLVLTMGAFGIWKFIIPFELIVPIQYPQGVDSTHFQLSHQLLLSLPNQQLKGTLQAKGFVHFLRVSGSYAPAPLQILSPYWELKDTEISINRDPKPIQLDWKDNIRRVQGSLKDNEGPVVGVRVNCVGTGNYSFTDELGDFVLELSAEQVPAIRHQLALSKPDYKTIHPTVNLGDGQQSYDFYLEKE